MKVKAIIEKGLDGFFSIYTEQIAGAVGSGKTETEAKADFLEVLEEQADFYKERKGCYPAWYDGELVVEYNN